MANTNVVKITRQKVLAKQDAPTFHVSVEETENPHNAQAFLDYGSSPGPWIKVGLNSTVYAFGYLPEKETKHEANSHPAPASS